MIFLAHWYSKNQPLWYEKTIRLIDLFPDSIEMKKFELTLLGVNEINLKDLEHMDGN